MNFRKFSIWRPASSSSAEWPVTAASLPPNRKSNVLFSHFWSNSIPDCHHLHDKCTVRLVRPQVFQECQDIVDLAGWRRSWCRRGSGCEGPGRRCRGTTWRTCILSFCEAPVARRCWKWKTVSKFRCLR